MVIFEWKRKNFVIITRYQRIIWTKSISKWKLNIWLTNRCNQRWTWFPSPFHCFFCLLCTQFQMHNIYIYMCIYSLKAIVKCVSVRCSTPEPSFNGKRIYKQVWPRSMNGSGKSFDRLCINGNDVKNKLHLNK